MESIPIGTCSKNTSKSFPTCARIEESTATVVEAAHIKPWSESHDDRPTTGLHSAGFVIGLFDEGLMGVGKDYEVLVSKRVRTEQNYLGHILTLIDRPIFKPDKKIYWPDKNNLEWHRKKKFGIKT